MPGQAANHWVGGAIAVAQVDTITVTSTSSWASSDTVTITCNGKDLLLTLGSSPANPTTADVAAMIAAIINGDAAIGNETRGETGDNVPEFMELDASVLGSVVTLTTTSVYDGKPFTVTVADSHTPDDVATSTTTSATGPHFWNNADNWSALAVPSTSDYIVFDNGSVDCLYGLDTSIEPAAFEVTLGYTGNIGLAEINTDDPNNPYPEYRSYKSLRFTHNSGSIPFYLGTGTGTGSGRIRLDLTDMQGPEVIVFDTGTAELTGVPSLLLIKTSANLLTNNGTLTILKGNVGLGFYGEVVGFDKEVIGKTTSVLGDVSCYVGKSHFERDSGDGGFELIQTGGTLTFEGGSTVDTYQQTAGVCTWRSGNVTLAEISGTVYWECDSTLTTVRIYSGGTLDFDRTNDSPTLTNCSMYGGGVLIDNLRTVTYSNGVDFSGCGNEDNDWQLGDHYTLEVSEI